MTGCPEGAAFIVINSRRRKKEGHLSRYKTSGQSTSVVPVLHSLLTVVRTFHTTRVTALLKHCNIFYPSPILLTKSPDSSCLFLEHTSIFLSRSAPINRSSVQCGFSSARRKHMCPWTTKLVLSVNFSKLRFYTLSKSWVNTLSIDFCFFMDRTLFGRDTTIWKSGIWGCKKNLNIEKIAFKVVQMKLLAMHITNQKLNCDIFTVRNVQNVFM